MARSTIQSYPDNSVDANWTAWITQIPLILSAGGFVQTADTGQADFSTLTKPTTFAQSRGYQIWRSDDATVGNGLSNYSVKVEVGSNPSNAIRPATWLTVGWGSDNAGNITGSAEMSGNIIPRTILSSNSNSTTVLSDSNFWCNTGAFNMCFFSSTVNSVFVFNIERVRDKTGAESDKIFIWGYASGTGVGLNHTLTKTTPLPVGTVTPTANQRNISSAQTGYNGEYGFSTIAPVAGVALMEATNIFGVDTTNFTASQSQHQMTVLGETRTYILNGVSGIWALNYRLLSRWDL